MERRTRTTQKAGGAPNEVGIILSPYANAQFQVQAPSRHWTVLISSTHRHPIPRKHAFIWVALHNSIVGYIVVKPSIFCRHKDTDTRCNHLSEENGRVGGGLRYLAIYIPGEWNFNSLQGSAKRRGSIRGPDKDVGTRQVCMTD